ncbi:tyrosine-protein phosphatase non-receptor type 9-like isoform X1 [Brienomyrus brachyistius]|uniref:tyrosine-protein phosphatase non-receptor type 9-like isoform X1 n=1 Tax=Brienomyrus brachyistius TaxID=42636 RepID=UPI0020B2EB2A|nr:tyrosine-protein phosphatase non-receptor type 9-like isoform X1 [Brienomyrus brachyistius]
MAEALTIQEELAVQEFLAEVRKLDQLGPVVASQNMAVKFLIARKFDVSRAVELFQAYRSTRLREGICDIRPEEEPLQSELLSGKFTVLPYRDARGAAIALFTARLHRPDYTTHKAVLQAVIYQLDKAIESIQTQRAGLVFIYDMTNSTYENFDYELSMKILHLLKGAFPARLKCVFIVSSPLWFRASLAVLRLLVREKLRERVCTLKTHELPRHIPKEALPEHLGGSARYSHAAWIQACIRADRMSATGDELGRDKTADGAAPHDHRCPLQGRTCTVAEPNADRFPKRLQGNYEEQDGSALTGKSTVVGTDMGTKERHHGNGHVANGHGPARRSPHRSDAASGVPPRRKDPGVEGAGLDGGPTHPAYAWGCGRTSVPSVHLPDDEGMTVRELVEHVKKTKKKGIFREYEEIRKEPPTGTFNHSRKPSNQMKNRYSDVLCLDHSRVKLSVMDNDETSDYINASFMDGYKRKNAYIATQGPLPRTFADFWRVVWEQRVLVIVMTTRVVERGRVKCGQYWPQEAGDSDTYGRLVVKNVHVRMFQDFRLSQLQVYDSVSGELRSVAHYLYVSWPDFGVPKSAGAMLDFRAQVKQHQEAAFRAMCADWTGPAGGPPLVVHCSAGIGRTGTFCALDICLSRLDDVGTVDVQRTVRRMRAQRAFSIQTWDQYYFCFMAVLEYAQRRGLLPAIQWSDSE